MEKITKIISTKAGAILIILALSVPTLIPLTKQGFFPTQDFIHVARLFEMDKSLKTGQFPVRWVPDFRNGEPLFNFYAPLPFYLGSLIHSLNFGFLNTTKILFALSFLLSGVTMFFLGKKLFGVWGGFIAAVLYTYAPYHSVDVYVRGAMSESLALIFFPLIFLSSYLLSQKANFKNTLFLALSLAGLFYTHNIMTVLFTPFFLGWVAFLVWNNKNWQVLKYFIFSLLLGFGLAASFLLPAFLEKSFVQSDKLITGYFDFRGHFVELKQFIIPSWGYGASLWGSEDGMSFQVGLTHLAVLAISILLSLIFHKDKKKLFLIIFLSLEFLFSLFMQHNKSTPIWVRFPILSYTQFPWRFLGISIFFVSLVGGSLGSYLKGKISLIAIALVVVIIAVNVGYFHPESYYSDSVDSHYVSNKVLSTDDKLPKDYLPIWVKQIKEEKILLPHTLNGKADFSEFILHSSSAQFNVKVQENSDIEIPITYFPGWEIKANNQLIKQEDPSNLGLIRTILAPGEYQIKANFSNTAIRWWGNLISLFSLLLIILLRLRGKFNFKWAKKLK